MAESESESAGRDTVIASHGSAAGRATITNWEWLDGRWQGLDWTRLGQSQCLSLRVLDRRGVPVALSSFQHLHGLSLAPQTVEVESVSLVGDGVEARVCIRAHRPGTSRVVSSAWDTVSFRYVGSYQPHHVLAEPLALRFRADRWELGVGQAERVELHVTGSQGNVGTAPTSEVSVSSSRADVAVIDDGGVARGAGPGSATFLASYSDLEAEARVGVKVYEIVAVRAGQGVTCLLMRRGTVRCAGLKHRPAIGYKLESQGGVLAFADAPDVPIGGPPVVDFGRGLAFRHLCVVQENAEVRCWGEGAYGKLGYGNELSVGNWSTPADAGAVSVGLRVGSVGMGEFHTCAVAAESGVVRCWGLNSAGQLGYGSEEPAVGDDETPASFGDVPLGGKAVQVQGGRFMTCALMETGRVRCWGINSDGWDPKTKEVAGQFFGLGYGDRFPPDQALGDDETPASVGDVPLPGRVEKLAVGGFHVCALIVGGAVRCWGSSWWGVLGDGSRGERIEHVLDAADAPELRFETPVVDLAAHYFHTCALLEDGSVRCWGLGDNGALGYGHTRNVGDDEPVTAAPPVPLGGPVAAIAVTYQGGCAVMRAGGLRCWGAPSDLGFTGAHLGDDEAPAVGGDVRVFAGPLGGTTSRAFWARKPTMEVGMWVSAPRRGPVAGPWGVLSPDSLPPVSSWPPVR